MGAEHVLPDSEVDIAQFSLPSNVLHLENYNGSLRISCWLDKPEESQGLANSFGRKLLNPTPGLEGPEGLVHPQG